MANKGIAPRIRGLGPRAQEKRICRQGGHRLLPHAIRRSKGSTRIGEDPSPLEESWAVAPAAPLCQRLDQSKLAPEHPEGGKIKKSSHYMARHACQYTVYNRAKELLFFLVMKLIPNLIRPTNHEPKGVFLSRSMMWCLHVLQVLTRDFHQLQSYRAQSTTKKSAVTVHAWCNVGLPATCCTVAVRLVESFVPRLHAANRRH